jgi:hypothetical protein
MNYQIHNPKFPMSGFLEATKKGRLGLVPGHLAEWGLQPSGTDLCEFALDLDPPGHGRRAAGGWTGGGDCRLPSLEGAEAVRSGGDRRASASSVPRAT